MRGHGRPFRGSTGGRDQGRDEQYPPFQPPSQPPQLALDLNLAFQTLNLYLQNAAYSNSHGFPPQQNFNAHFPYHQNPNFPIKNPNIPSPQQFPNDLPQQHGYSSSRRQHQPPQFVTQQQSQNLHHQQGQKLVEQKGKERFEGAVKEARFPNVYLKDQHERAELQSHSSEKQQAQNSPIQNMKQVKYQRQYKKQFVNEGQELIGRVDKAVEKAWGDLIASGECVSTWKVSQAALMIHKVESWDSLGFRMQEVPSLNRLILVEGKINAFIHCFVGVRRITSLYDLEVAICENEGIERFEELGLGSILRHPLVVHYFLVSSDVTEVVKITTEDIILSLHEYMTTCSKKDVIIDEFLDFIAKKRSAKGKGNLGIRIQSLGMHISFIREARRSEQTALKKCRNKLNEKSGAEIPMASSTKGSGNKSQKRSFSPSQKKNLDERFSEISQRVESFAYTHKDFRGKHIRFDSSGPEDEESDDSTDEYDMNCNDDKSPFHLQNVHKTERVSTCPYPSATEEISRLGLKGEIESPAPPFGSSSTLKRREGHKRKREHEDTNRTDKLARLLEVKAGRKIMNAIADGKNNKVANISETDLSLSYNSIKSFITIWKETCKEHTLAEVLARMADFCRPEGLRGDRKMKTLRRKIKVLFSLEPWIGLLNVAVTAIKSDMFHSIYNAFDSVIENELPTARSEYESIDVEPSEKQTSFVSHGRLQQIHNGTNEDAAAEVINEQNVETFNHSSTVNEQAEREPVRNNKDQPFMKTSYMWKHIDSLEIFRILPQNPHFKYLSDCNEETREGSAIGQMVTFASLVEKVTKLQIDDPTSLFDRYLEALAILDEIGFDVKVVVDRVNDLLSLKTRQEHLDNRLKRYQSLVAECDDRKVKLEQDIDAVNKMGELVEQREFKVSQLPKKESGRNFLQLQVSSIKNSMFDVELEFKVKSSARWPTAV